MALEWLQVFHISVPRKYSCVRCVYTQPEHHILLVVCVCACESLWIVYVCERRICMCTFTRELSHTVKLVKPTHSCCIKNITVSHACLSIWMWTWVLTVRVCLTIVSFKRQKTKGNLLTLFMHFPSKLTWNLRYVWFTILSQAYKLCLYLNTSVWMPDLH